MENCLIIERSNLVERIEALTTTNLRKRGDLVKIMRSVMNTAKKVVQQAARTNLQSDPRAAYKAVRTVVYKKLIGGNVNILNARRGKATHRPYSPKRYGDPTKRGGNRMKRSQRTENFDTYYGASRGFILRFVNNGTTSRTTKNPRGANRGVISGRQWFEAAGRAGTQQACEQLMTLMERLITEVWNE